MELLDMVPADAIALRLYSLPAAVAAAGSLYYAWLVAALAAAVGLWRIRSVGAGVRKGSSVDEKPQAQAAPSPSPAIDEPRPAARSEPAKAASRSEPRPASKVRFTAYYGVSGEDDDGVVDGVRKCADEEDADGVDGEAEAVLRRTASAPERRRATAVAEATWEEREMAMRRRGDLGWYRHLDMAALDGSVVRLWDGELTASPRGRKRRRARLELQLSF